MALMAKRSGEGGGGFALAKGQELLHVCRSCFKKNERICFTPTNAAVSLCQICFTWTGVASLVWGK